MKASTNVKDAIMSQGSVDGNGRRFDAEAKLLVSDKQIGARLVKDNLPWYDGMSYAEVEEKCLTHTVLVGETPATRAQLAVRRVMLLSGEDVTPGEGSVYFDLRRGSAAPRHRRARRPRHRDPDER